MYTSISFTTGRGSISHNQRTIKNSNLRHIDPSRTKDNVLLVGDYKRDLLMRSMNNIFAKEVEQFNAKTKRKDRQIKNAYDYFSKFGSRTGRRKLFREFVIQMGSSEDKQQIPKDVVTKIYSEYIEGFKLRNPTLIPFLGVIHNDEKSPHIHLDIIPKNHTNTKLGVGNSFAGALQDLGYPKSDRMAYAKWRYQEVMALAQIMESYGYHYEYLGNTEKHSNTVHPDAVKAIKSDAKKELAQKVIEKQDDPTLKVTETKFGGFTSSKEEAVPKASYDELVKKNVALQEINDQQAKQIIDLKRDKQNLLHNGTIERLNKEINKNTTLNEKVSLLSQKATNLGDDVNKLKYENAELKEEVDFCHKMIRVFKKFIKNIFQKSGWSIEKLANRYSDDPTKLVKTFKYAEEMEKDFDVQD